MEVEYKLIEQILLGQVIA